MTLEALCDYGVSFQRKVLGALLTDKKFLLNVRDLLKPEYFNSAAHKWIIQQVLHYFDEFHTTCTMAVLKIELQKETNAIVQVAVKEELKNSYEASQDDLEYVEEEFTLFCRNQEMRRAILDSAEKLKFNDFEGIRALVENALKAGVEKSIGHEYEKDIESRYRKDYRPTVPSPWKSINDLFSGGLGPGDLMLIFGGPGAGKTWLAIAYAANAVKLGYKVIYYTLELGAEYVGRRFDSYFTGYSVDECADHRAEVEALVAGLPGKLVIKEYPPRTATITSLEAHVQKCQDEGTQPDLIIIDYIDYLRPGNGKGRYSERKDEIDDVYVGAKKLAKELHIPVISPSQVNRAGARDQIVEGDKAAGSYDKLMVSDCAMSLSRQKEDKVAGTGRVFIMKNRYGRDGIAFNVTFDSSTGRVDFLDEREEDPAVATPSGTYHIDKDILSKLLGK
jgi:replicative DNA helicase